MRLKASGKRSKLARKTCAQTKTLFPDNATIQPLRFAELRSQCPAYPTAPILPRPPRAVYWQPPLMQICFGKKLSLGNRIATTTKKNSGSYSVLLFAILLLKYRCAFHYCERFRRKKQYCPGRTFANASRTALQMSCTAVQTVAARQIPAYCPVLHQDPLGQVSPEADLAGDIDWF